MRFSAAVLALLSLLALPALAADPAVILMEPFFDSVDPGTTAYVLGRIANVSDAPLLTPELHVRVPAGIRLTDPYPIYGWTCTAADGAIDCAGETLSPKDSFQLSFGLVLPADHPGGLVPMSVTLTWSGGSTAVNAAVPVSRPFVVNSTGDSGSGSLRAAIEAANAQCTGQFACRIFFQFPGGDTLPRIEPLTPLPAVTATNVAIGANDMRSREALPPLVELSGSRLRSSGSGITIRTNQTSYTQPVHVLRMVINGFPENGIDIEDGGVGSPFRIAYNRIGTDVTGTQPVPNGLRGIVVNAPAGSGTIVGNVIGGNSRSGIAIWRTAAVQVDDNWIGIAQDGRPLSNGGSGVYVESGAKSCQLSGGVIAFNHDFGVAIGHGARNVSVVNAAIAENLANDVDWNLDGASPLVDKSVPEPPLITSAVYDATTNKTTFRGTLHGFERTFGNYFRVVLYASDHVTRWGVTPMTNFAGSSPFVHGYRDGVGPIEFVEPWEIVVPGDYRGAWVSAQTVTQDWPDLPSQASSELGPALKVN